MFLRMFCFYSIRRQPSPAFYTFYDPTEKNIQKLNCRIEELRYYTIFITTNSEKREKNLAICGNGMAWPSV